MKLLLFCFILVTTVWTTISAQTDILLTPANDGQTYSLCSGTLFDTGGQGGPGYGANEHTTITLCSTTPGKGITLDFSVFNLSTLDASIDPLNPDIDFLKAYDGSNTSATLIGTFIGTELSGKVLSTTNLNLTGCLTLEFYSNSLATGTFAASISCNLPCSHPVAVGTIQGGITADSIRVCQNEPISFRGSSSIAQTGFNIASYSWDFKDNTTSNVADPIHSYSVPGFYTIQLYVTDNNPDVVCSNTNLIDLQVLVAPKPDFTGFAPDTTLCIGESVVFTADPESYEVTWTGFPTSASILDGCLTDDQLGVQQVVNLTQTGFIAGSMITNINDILDICVEMEHSFIGDIVVRLNCPNGQSMILHQQGGSGTDLGVPVPSSDIDCLDPSTIGVPGQYCFTPLATETWDSYVNNNGFPTSLPSGDYLPIDPFTNLIGCPTNGIWSISVTDNWAIDDGCLFSFGLTLSPSFYPNMISFEPQIGLGIDSSYWNASANFVSNLSANGDVATITPTAAGTYNYVYTVIDNFGCTADTSVNVIVDPNSTLFAGNDTSYCLGQTLQLDAQITGGNSVCDYELTMMDDFGDGWNLNTLTVTINGTASNYTLSTGSLETVLLSIPNGATVTAVFNADGSFLDEVSFEIKDPQGNSVVMQGPNLSSTTSDAFTGVCPPNFIYSWTAANVVSDPTILDPQFTDVNSQTLTIEAYPIGHPNCVVSDDIAITVLGFGYAGVDNTFDICSTASPVDLTSLLGPGITPGGTWTNPTGGIISMPFDPATMVAGNYTYTVDNGGCIDDATISVQILDTEITGLQVTNVNCFGSLNGSVTVTGNSFFSYSINSGTSVLSGSPFSVQNLGPGVYQIDVLSSTGCQDDTVIVITQPAPLQITSLTSDATVCLGDAISLDVAATGGDGAYLFGWFDAFNPAGVGSQLIISPTISSQYCVVVTEACGSLPDTACLEMTVALPVEPLLLTDTTQGCAPLDILFSHQTIPDEVQRIDIDFGDGEQKSFTNTLDFSHQYKKRGIYDVAMTITSTNGCQSHVEYDSLIEAFYHPTADFWMNPDSVSMLYPVVSLYNSSTEDAIELQWFCAEGFPDSSSAESFTMNFPVDSAKSYPVKLIAIDSNSCRDSITKAVIVHSETILYAPNTFTPNSDVYNPTWRVHAIGLEEKDFSLKIFNRWGQLVWHSNSMEIEWDGTFNGTIVDPGAYTWIINSGSVFNDKRYVFNGTVNVLR